MKEYLAKGAEATRRLVSALVRLARWTVEHMRAVEIDRPAGAALCVALQLAAIVALVAVAATAVESVPARPPAAAAAPESAEPAGVVPYPP
jgi:hypothetical protein